MPLKGLRAPIAKLLLLLPQSQAFGSTAQVSR
jgi:hypothetical protein